MGIYETAAGAIGGKFDTALAVGLGLPVAYDNVAFAAQNPSRTTPVVWLRASSEFEGVEQLGFSGDNTYRIRGEASIEILSTVGMGDDSPLSRVETVKTAFRDLLVTPVQFEDPYHLPQGREGAWHVIEVRCPFRVDHTQAPTRVSVGSPASGAVHDIARARLDSVVAVPNSIPTSYDNAPAFQPGTVAWIRANLLAGRIAAVDHAGTRTRRTPGLFKVMVSTPLDKGTQSAWQIADKVADAFRAVTVGGVHFTVPNARSGGRSGGWWTTIVDCPFRADETV